MCQQVTLAEVDILVRNQQILIDEVIAWRLYYQMKKDPSKMNEKKRKSIIESMIRAVIVTDNSGVLPEKVKP